MKEIFDTIRPLLSGGVAVLIVFLLIKYAKNESKRDGDIRVLEYGFGFKAITIVLGGISGLVVYAAIHARDDQLFLAFIISALFVTGTCFLVYQAFFVKFSYDDTHVYYSSLLIRHKKVPWESLEEIGHSYLVQADYIRMKGIGKIWCSNMLNGYEELGEFLERLTEKLDED